VNAWGFRAALRLPIPVVVDARAGGGMCVARLVLTALLAASFAACASTPLASVSLPAPAVSTVGTPTPSGPTVTVTPASVPSKAVAPARVRTVIPVVPSGPVKPAPVAAVSAPSTLVGHILRGTKAYSAPTGGHVVGALTAETRGVYTWVPVVSQVPGWVQVRMLVGRTVTTGWVPATAVDIADAKVWVEVAVAAKTLTLHQSGKPAKTWSVLALGDAGSRWPTPVGSYWLERFARFSNLNPVYGPGVRAEISARGTWASSDRISIHAWRAAIRPGESSHGCVRVPDGAAAVIASLPYGTPVEIRP
jgi:L,D-transpeptidase catalytic domain